MKSHADEVYVFWGLSPNLGPIAEWGLDIDKRQIRVDTEKFETSETGIFAVGDINTYPGKKKLILSGFHEAALAAFGVQKHLDPDKRVFLQYTTTSPIMHKRLGLEKDQVSRNTRTSRRGAYYRPEGIAASTVLLRNLPVAVPTTPITSKAAR